jgi:hypothetical protein
MKFSLLIFTFLILVRVEDAQSALHANLFKNEKAIFEEYMRLHRKYVKYMCSKGDDQVYAKLLRNYLGEGYYLPILAEEKLDKKSIKTHLPVIEKKIAWIKRQIKYLKRKKSFKSAHSKIKKIEENVDELLKLKKTYSETDFSSVKKQTENESKVAIDKLKIRWKRLIEEIPFLIGFGYPVNHFEMRKAYDVYRDLKGAKSKQEANSLYFERKIYEDGAQNKDRSKSDKFSRALVNMMYFNLRNEDKIISENIRYDMSSILTNLKIYLNWSKRHHLSRLNEWLVRTQKTLDFYKKIITESDKKSLTYLKKKSRSTYAIKRYVGRKQAKSYEYWMQYPEMYRAIFSISTILFNEVGDMDGKDALERKDVAQVVINRSTIPFFSSLEKRDSIMPYLSKKIKTQVFSFPWLNLLFKTGEFSFTYYYIGATSNIFCPDGSPRGKALREDNIWLALELLKKPNSAFKATRYFSRASMLGRIDMTPMWDDYVPLNERPGSLIGRPAKLRRAYRKGQYHYLYSFEDPKGDKFEVIEISRKTYVINEQGKMKQFYNYRNPNYFKYFSARSY